MELYPVRSIKIVSVGDDVTGKTSLLITYATNSFPEDYTPTVFDDYSKTLLWDTKPIKLKLMDTSGHDIYDRLRPLAYSQADIFLLIFSVVSPPSFHNLRQRWLPDLLRYRTRPMFLIVGTKTDLRDKKEVLERLSAMDAAPIRYEQGKALADDLGAVGYAECSAITQEGVDRVFDMAIKAVLGQSQSDAPKRDTESKPKCTSKEAPKEKRDKEKKQKKEKTKNEKHHHAEAHKHHFWNKG